MNNDQKRRLSQLEEKSLSGNGSTDDLVKSAGSECRDHLDDAVLPRCTSKAELTLGMAQLAERRRGDVNRET